MSKSKKLIAFRSVDKDNDIWCENVIFFESEDEVRQCFQQDNKLLIEIFTDEDDEDRTLQDFQIREIGDTINSVTFWTEYAHDVRLVRMDSGYIYEK